MRSSNFSAALRALEKQEFVERRSDASDGCTANLFVTALAKKNIDIVRSRRAALLAPAFGDDVSQIEAARELLLLLDRLRNAAREGNS
jgi:DNA-binding MarR family transcriptional regulator